jgi:hypothetical protein
VVTRPSTRSSASRSPAVTERIRLLTHLSVVPYQPVPAGQKRPPRPLLAGPVHPRHRHRLPQERFFALGVDTDGDATRCSTRRSTCCRRRGRASRSTPRGPFAKGVIQRPALPEPDPDLDRGLKLSRRRAPASQGWMPMGIPEGGQDGRSPPSPVRSWARSPRSRTSPATASRSLLRGLLGEARHPTKAGRHHRDRQLRHRLTWVNVGCGPMAPRAAR